MLVGLFLVAAQTTPIAPTGVAHPPDPFGETYAPPRAEEMGTASDQLRVVGMLGGGHGEGVDFGAEGLFEWMASSYVGVRFASRLLLPTASKDPELWSFSLGPSLHFLPYRRVDLELFFEGGLALVDITKATRTAMPIVAGGAGIDVALTSLWVVHAEGALQAGVADRAGKATVLVTPLAFLGVGLTL